MFLKLLKLFMLVFSLSISYISACDMFISQLFALKKIMTPEVAAVSFVIIIQGLRYYLESPETESERLKRQHTINLIAAHDTLELTEAQKLDKANLIFAHNSLNTPSSTGRQNIFHGSEK